MSFREDLEIILGEGSVFTVDGRDALIEAIMRLHEQRSRPTHIWVVTKCEEPFMAHAAEKRVVVAVCDSFAYVPLITFQYGFRALHKLSDIEFSTRDPKNASDDEWMTAVRYPLNVPFDKG